MKLSRQRGLQLEAFGSILIVTVMLADRFLFSIQDGFRRRADRRHSDGEAG